MKKQVRLAVGEGRLYAVEDLKKEEGGEERNDSEEGVRAFAGKAAGVWVRVIIEASGDGQNASAGLL